ncbi:hypothetical protein KKG83_00470 [Candidatus Micrarchaeota archaeon]|nr:hypothetical protein [Candidatus Micrarchaeota archaeon]MBU2475925.1 hypothetical protein [Candidatus Micrarchaeota archaeon]
MNFNERTAEIITALGYFRSRINLLNFGLFIIALSGFSVYFAFPLHELVVAFAALFFPGYLFFRLIIKSSSAVETFVVSIVLSMGIIVFSTFILTVVFSFPLDKITITSAAVFSDVVFLGIHFLKGVLSE